MATTHEEVDEYSNEIEAINDWVHTTIDRSETIKVLRVLKTVAMTGVALTIIAGAIGYSIITAGRKQC